MNRMTLLTVSAVLAVTAGALLAVPAVRGGTEDSNGKAACRAESGRLRLQDLEHCLDEIHSQLEGRIADVHRRVAGRLAHLDGYHDCLEHATEIQHDALIRAAGRMHNAMQSVTVHPGDVTVFSSDGDGWLGITITEVTAETVKEKKLSAERGVLVQEVTADSPAVKAGLKAGDVITEYNGVRIEGVTQLRRMVRETPAGRTAQITVWRDGRAQQLPVEMGSVSSRWEDRVRTVVRPNFEFRIPNIDISLGRTPTLGVYTEDVSGQLGSYFGVPGEEGVLIREVRSGSAAEKAGLKAGDVIIKVDGARVRDASGLRARLREKRDAKSVAIAVIRNRAETTVNVEIEQPRPPERRTLSYGRRIAM
ncbi:MAG TPA: PDZ domain-containing protein [Candidatus Acidoferrales bacterium]